MLQDVIFKRITADAITNVLQSFKYCSYLKEQYIIYHRKIVVNLKFTTIFLW